MSISFPEAAERLLQVDLPHWNHELLRLQVLLLAVSFVWLIGLPLALRRVVKPAPRRSRTRCDTTSASRPPRTRHRIPWYAGVLGLVGFFATAVALIIFVSPYNVYSSRRVFQVPMLTEAECQHIIDMAFAAAERNVEKLSKRDVAALDEDDEAILEDPPGWQKWRHKDYPTNDLNLVTDPFTADDQDWLRGVADQRLAPLLSRIYGFPARSIQARDMFVVRYDAETLRSKLAKHTDGGDISFTIFLNNEFEGGGTQFWNRYKREPFALLQSDSAGHLSTFPALIQHEGYPTTAGRRMILVGFLDVVRFEADGKTPTGLSLFASWGNVNWVMSRIRDVFANSQWESKKLRLKAYKAISWVEKWHDRLVVHAMAPTLVKQEHVPEFLEVLDKSFNDSDRSTKARWLEGQQKKAFLEFMAELYDEEYDDYDERNYDDESEEL